MLSMIALASKTGVYFSFFNLAYSFWGITMFSFGLSILWVLAFESPMIAIEKLIFKGFSNLIICIGRKKSKKTEEMPYPNKSSRSYDEIKLQAALSAIRGDMAILGASKVYNVPRTTLRHKLADRAPENIAKRGPECLLGEELESLSGKKWYNNFMKRHSELSYKKSEYLNKARANVSEENIRRWFKETLLLLGKDSEVLKDPSRCWNMDGTASYLNPSGGCVIAEKGKPVYIELHLIVIRRISPHS
ncbi:hypothetical protein NQ314_007796 [Rhamnusium bicolor]|uniref:HTH psq-type domain-containing protein n=1 Tax=Rhamnusium bicolor TaxID=1586634 RepID=A0AAV8YII6_9CUCU|nr:hypothetical protein NQ314_007796 [Rhamnusium bicolor]